MYTSAEGASKNRIDYYHVHSKTLDIRLRTVLAVSIMI